MELTKTKKITVAMIIELYQRENKLLKEKIEQLESKIDKLVNDKEQMLIDERNKIEAIYLEVINTKLLLENSKSVIHDVSICEATDSAEKLVELKKYLKTLGLSSKKRKIIKENFLKKYDDDIRIIKQNGKLFLNFSKYDYSDLLN
jgi:hypothetical protein